MEQDYKKHWLLPMYFHFPFFLIAQSICCQVLYDYQTHVLQSRHTAISSSMFGFSLLWSINYLGITYRHIKLIHIRNYIF